jgi:hypothetical protein
MKGRRALVGAVLAALALVALAVPASAAPGDLEQNIVMQGNAVHLRTRYTPDPKVPWDSVQVTYRISYTRAGTSDYVTIREGQMKVSNNGDFKQQDGTHQVLVNAFVVLGPNDKIYVEFLNRTVYDKNERELAYAKDTMLEYFHYVPGQRTAQLGGPCLDGCLAQAGAGDLRPAAG